MVSKYVLCLHRQKLHFSQMHEKLAEFPIFLFLRFSFLFYFMCMYVRLSTHMCRGLWSLKRTLDLLELQYR